MRVHIGKYPKYPKSEDDRKVSIRIDPYDTWSMDHTLALIIHPMLIQLKETKHGSPWVDDEDVPEHLRSTAAEPKENEWDTDSNLFDRWDWILGEMIWAFERIIKDDGDTYFYEKYADDEVIEPVYAHIINEMINRLMYSAKKKKANLIPEYSVWKPAVSSDSASAKSKGPRFVSAVPAIKKTINATKEGICPVNKYHPSRCPSTIVENCIEPANTIMVSNDKDTESS